MIGPEFILYDGRAKLLGTENASILDTAVDEADARLTGKSWRGHDAVWVQYVNPQPGIEPDSIVYDEKFRPDIPPCKKR